MATRMSQDAGPGHNEAGGVDPDTFVDFYRQLIDADRDLAEAQSARSNLLKKAKKAGVDLDALKAVRALAKKDSEEVEARFRILARYSEWIGRPLGFQAGLFGEADDQKPADASVAKLKATEVEQQGYTDATHNTLRDNNPHAAGSEFAAAWDKGWHKGRDFMQRSGKLEEQAQQGTPRQRRGRANGAAQHEGATT